LGALIDTLEMARITRFTVMSVLQAARASVLGLPKDSAYSWGLNKAIFFAAAKRGFKGGGGKSTGGKFETSEKSTKKPSGEDQDVFFLGSDKAFLDREASSKEKPLFTIGGETQTESDFKKQVAARFGSESNFEKAWNEAMEIVKGYDKGTLDSGSEFFDQVYKPRRDMLAQKWTETFTEKES